MTDLRKGSLKYLPMRKRNISPRCEEKNNHRFLIYLRRRIISDSTDFHGISAFTKSIWRRYIRSATSQMRRFLFSNIVELIKFGFSQFTISEVFLEVFVTVSRSWSEFIKSINASVTSTHSSPTFCAIRETFP